VKAEVAMPGANRILTLALASVCLAACKADAPVSEKTDAPRHIQEVGGRAVAGDPAI